MRENKCFVLLEAVITLPAFAPKTHTTHKIDYHKVLKIKSAANSGSKLKICLIHGRVTPSHDFLHSELFFSFVTHLELEFSSLNQLGRGNFFAFI
jgi:hypothetical protein